MKTGASMNNTSGAPSARSMLTSFTFHAVALCLLLLVPEEAWRHSVLPKPQVDIVFRRPAPVAIPVPANPLPPPRTAAPSGPRPGPAVPKPKPDVPPNPEGPGKPDLPEGPKEGPSVEAQIQQKVGHVGILALKDKFASLTQDKTAPRLGADARYGAADDVGRPSSPSRMTTNSPGSSAGINLASLNHNVGGGGSGGGGGIPGVSVGRATSTIAGIGGGDRPLSHSGPGPSRTDEEIQIVFDRYKSSFYRTYNRMLRNDPTLRGQLVLRLTIEPDGSVSMCKLQSSDMNAPELAEQVV